MAIASPYLTTPTTATTAADAAKKAQEALLSANSTGVAQPAAPAAANTNKYSNIDYISGIADQLYKQYEPQVQSDIQASAQQYSDLGRQQNEYAANMGMNRSGQAIQNIGRLGQAGINANNDIRSKAMMDAQTRALPYAQMAMTEQNAADDLSYRNKALDSDTAYQQATLALQQQGMTLDEAKMALQGSQFDRSFAAQQATDAFNQGIQTAGVTGKYNGQDTVDAQQIALNNALNVAGVTGTYNGQDTLAKTTGQNNMAANIWDTYSTGTDKYTMPDWVSKLMKSMY